MMIKTSLPPGFRFHPTDVELVWYYLKRKIMGKPFRFEAISEVELYKFAPWDLPAKSCLRSNDLEWYFFCPRDRKYANGSRRNRATEIGYWKATGRDRSVAHNSQTVGMKKTLIFHEGKAPHGFRTDWVMYEFRLESKDLVNAGYEQEAYVLCKIFQKSGLGPKNGEQYGAPFKEEDWEDADIEDSVSFPSIPPAGNAHLFVHPPVQSVAPEVGLVPPMPSRFEIGELSSAVSNFEVGEPSRVPEPSKVGELPSVRDTSEVGEPFYMPGPFDDGIFVDQLEAFLNSPQPHSENVNDLMLDASLRHENVTPAPDLDFVNVYGILPALPPLPTQPHPEPADGSFGNVCHPAAADFADEHYMELSDIGFVGEGNPMGHFAPGDYFYPFANVPSSFGPDNTYVDNDVDTFLASESQQIGHAVSYDEFPSTMGDHHLRKEGNL